MKCKNLENRIHKKISEKGELGFFIIPGAYILEARRDVRVNPDRKEIYYSSALFSEGIKLTIYSGIVEMAYELYQFFF